MRRRAPLRALALMLAAALGVAACSAAGQPAGGAAKTAAAHPAGAATESGGGAAVPRVAPVTIAAVGDTMLGSTPNLPPDPRGYFRAVRRELRAQIVFGNLEGTLTTATAGKCGPVHARSGDCFAFRDPPGYVRYLKRAGFTILNNANNHSFDFGAAGQAQTVRTIRAARLAQTGLPGQITLVIASGPHVLRGMQFYRHHLIAYSLANFANYHNFAATGDLGMTAILHVTLSATGAFEHARIYPIQLTGQGRPVPGGGAISLVSRLSAQDFGASAARILPSGLIKEP